MWLILSYTVQVVIPDVCTKFQILCQLVPAKSLTKKRNKNGQIKGLISNTERNLYYIVQLVISDVCTKFQNPKSSSS